MDGNIVTAARWLGGSLVLASVIFAINQKSERSSYSVAANPPRYAKSPSRSPVPLVIPAPRNKVEASLSLVADQERQEKSRVPILDPGDCTDSPPSDDEVWDRYVSASRKQAPLTEAQRRNRRIVVEKIGDKTDPPRNYPLAGLCRLEHHHYRCTITFDETRKTNSSVPINHTVRHVEVVYLDKDHLIRVASGLEKRE